MPSRKRVVIGLVAAFTFVLVIVLQYQWAESAANDLEREQWLAQHMLAPQLPLTAEEMQQESIEVLLWNDITDFFGDWSDVQCGYRCSYVTDRSLMDKASAVLFHGPTYEPKDVPPSATRPKHQPWVLLSSETFDYFPVMKQASWWKQFQLLSTFHRNSDIPVGYNALPKMNGEEAEQYVKAGVGDRPQEGQAAAAFFANNCAWSPGAIRRADYVRAMMTGMAIDSYGSCVHTKDYPSEASLGARPQNYNVKNEMSRKYKFVLAFENANLTDWVTEKVWHAFHAGAVPVYMGAQNIHEHLPAAQSIIDINHFDSPQHLVDYLLYLDQHDGEYAKLQAWRDKPVRESFKKFFDDTFEALPCRICKAVAGFRRDSSALDYPTSVTPGSLRKPT